MQILGLGLVCISQRCSDAPSAVTFSSSPSSYGGTVDDRDAVRAAPPCDGVQGCAAAPPGAVPFSAMLFIAVFGISGSLRCSCVSPCSFRD